MRPPLLALLAVAVTPLHAVADERPDLLITDALVMTMAEGAQDLPSSDILIRDGRIVRIGTDLQAPDARRIDGRGMIAMPGFVDTHSHLWVTLMRGQFRNAQGKFFPVSNQLAAAMTPQDNGLAMQVGALELLNAGITTTADFFDNIYGPEDAEAGLQALDASGIRALMYYGGPDKTTRRPIDMADLRQRARGRDDDARIRLGLAWRLPRDLADAGNWRMRDAEYAQAREDRLPVQVHVSGDAAAMFDALVERDLLSPRLTVVHATDATQAQLQALEHAGASLALTPLSEQRVGYGLTRLDRFAAVSRQGLGIDGNTLAGRADMFANLRLAALTWSGGVRDETAPDPRALLELATRRAADAVGLGTQIGTLEVGKRADLQLIDTRALDMAGFGGGDPAALLLYSATPQHVRTVIVDGVVRKRDGGLTGVALDALIERANNAARALKQRAEQGDASG